MEQLLRNYTQNIDTLETLAGVKRVLQCHGSFATASCLRCRTRVPGPSIEPYIMRQEVPICGICRKARDEEIAERRAIKARTKGKGKANWDGEEDDSDDDQGWGYGLPGIMKVSTRCMRSLPRSELTRSPTSPSLARRWIQSSTRASLLTEKWWTYC